MPRFDDLSIEAHCVLIRAVRREWFVDQPKTRLSSATFRDGQHEASCFIASEIGELEGFCEHILPLLISDAGVDLGAATITAGVVREHGLWIYRKPEEFHGNPAHVVICKPDTWTSSQFAKRSGKLQALADIVIEIH